MVSSRMLSFSRIVYIALHKNHMLECLNSLLLEALHVFNPLSCSSGLHEFRPPAHYLYDQSWFVKFLFVLKFSLINEYVLMQLGEEPCVIKIGVACVSLGIVWESL